MKALVTGGGGFLGRCIVEQLVARGDQVRTFSRGSYPWMETLPVDVRRGDIRDAEAVAAACEAMEVVYHTAAVSGIWGSWEHFHGINTDGTHNVVAGCLRQGVPRLVYTSSPSVTFSGGDQRHVDETAPYPQIWLCHYPHSKALAEQHVLQAHGQDQLATCALRPHLIWGPGDHHLIPRLIQRARRGQLRRVGDGTNLIDVTYVENAASAHLQAASALAVDSVVGGNAYFISQGEPVNCWQWINQILAMAGLPPVRKCISHRSAWNLGAAMEIVYRWFRIASEPRMTRFLAAQLSTSHYFDISRARKDFGYHPRVTTEEGMRRLASALQPAG